MFNPRLLKYADYPLWIAVAILVIAGFLVIYSATLTLQVGEIEDPLFFVKRHAFAFILALIGTALLAYTDYNNLKVIALPLYVFILFFLLLVMFKGYASYGAQRWLGLGFISVQPSEIAKLGIIIVYAWYLEKRWGQIKNLFSLIPTILIFGIPFFLIFKQPDLGTALTFLVLPVGMLLWAQARPLLILMFFTPLLSIAFRPLFPLWVAYLIIFGLVLLFIRLGWIEKIFFFAANVGVGVIMPVVWNLLHEYQKKRLLAFLNPEIDPMGMGYHTLQSKIAIGSGGFLGKGLLKGIQTQLQFIPHQQTDFIFSVIGEELGGLGGLFILILFVIIIWRAVKIAAEARDPFGSLVAAGIAIVFTFHLFVNVGMTMGLLPVVGIPLPFLSYGGTSLVINLMAIGILQSISMRRKKLVF